MGNMFAAESTHSLISLYILLEVLFTEPSSSRVTVEVKRIVCSSRPRSCIAWLGVRRRSFWKDYTQYSQVGGQEAELAERLYTSQSGCGVRRWSLCKLHTTHSQVDCVLIDLVCGCQNMPVVSKGQTLADACTKYVANIT